MNKTISTFIFGSVLMLTSSTALFAETSTSTGHATTSAKAKVKKVDTLCLQNALEKRDITLITGITTLDSSLVKALTTRKDALKLAVALPTKTEMTTARRVANQTFEKSVKEARSVMRTERISAWSTYKTQIKACGSTEVEQPAVIESSL